MKYKTQLLSLVNTPIGHKGVLLSLCDTCKTRDCDHVIEKNKVSIFGINSEYRMLVKGNQKYFVVSCEGYSQ